MKRMPAVLLAVGCLTASFASAEVLFNETDQLTLDFLGANVSIGYQFRIGR
jgi:hypothetical protein